MKNKKGFTLVELIVVLAILAVLAGLLVPALTEYIDKAKKSKYMLDAKQCMTAFQTEISELYAQGKDIRNYDVKKDDGKNGDISLLKTSQASDVLKLIDRTPYMLIMGTGEYNEYAGEGKDINKSYTVYFVAYWPTREENPIFFDGTSWTNKYPWVEHKLGNGNNSFPVNGENVKMQFYFLTAPVKNSNLSKNWDDLKCRVGAGKTGCSY